MYNRRVSPRRKSEGKVSLNGYAARGRLNGLLPSSLLLRQKCVCVCRSAPLHFSLSSLPLPVLPTSPRATGIGTGVTVVEVRGEKENPPLAASTAEGADREVAGEGRALVTGERSCRTEGSSSQKTERRAAPAEGSTSVPSANETRVSGVEEERRVESVPRETLISLLPLNELRRCFVRGKGSFCTVSHSTAKGVPQAA